MAPLDSVDVQIKAGKLIDLYRELFQARFSELPVLDIGQSVETCKWIIQNCGGFDRACRLLRSYLLIKDDWIVGQGFSLEWFKNNINRVITMSGKNLAAPKIQYVVAISENGHPVVDYDPHCMNHQTNFIAMTWNEWLRATLSQRMQKLEFLQKPGVVEKWLANWKEWEKDWKNTDTSSAVPSPLTLNSPSLKCS